MDTSTILFAFMPMAFLTMPGSRASQKPLAKYSVVFASVFGVLSGMMTIFSLDKISEVLGYISFALFLIAIILLPNKTLKFHGEQVINLFARLFGIFNLICALVFLIVDFKNFNDSYMFLIMSFLMLDIILYYKKPDDEKQLGNKEVSINE